MCKKTAKKPAATLEKIRKIQPNPLVLPFRTTPYVLDLLPDVALQAALKKAVNDAAQKLGPSPHVPFSLILISTNGTHKYCGLFDDEMFFSASLLKVAPMYAAFELRAAVQRFAESKDGITAGDATIFFQRLSNVFDPQIDASALAEVRVVSAKLGAKFHVDGYRSTPAYDKIFEVTDFGGANPPQVKFKKSGAPNTKEFTENLTEMITISGDEQARQVIKALSYSYIYAALTRAGFFVAQPDPRDSKGVWLGGDYSFGADPFLDFHLGGNVDLAEVTTTLQISRLFALIQLKKLVSEDSSLYMQWLLGNSNLSWLSLVKPPITEFDVTLRKVGIANNVFSEGELLKWRNTTKFASHNLTGEVAACWQNLRVFTTENKQFTGIANVLRQTIALGL